MGRVLAALRPWRSAPGRGRRANPYVVGAPVLDPELLCGRAELLASIVLAVRHVSVLLHGDRRMGKTSILHHLGRRLAALDERGWEYVPVLVDLQGITEGRLFATIAEEVLPELAISPRCVAVKREDGGAGYGPGELACDVREAMARREHSRQRQCHLVLLLDEADELTGFSPEANRGLRGFLSRDEPSRVTAVVSGVQVARHWLAPGSPWHRFFTAVEVTPLDREAAEELITRPVRGLLRWDAGAVDRIRELTGGRPHPIQRVCAGLVDRSHEGRRRRVTVADVEEVWAGLARSP